MEKGKHQFWGTLMGEGIIVLFGGMWLTVVAKIRGREGCIPHGSNRHVGVCVSPLSARTGLPSENDGALEEGALSHLMLTSSVPVTVLHQSPWQPLHLDFSDLKKRRRQVEYFF